MKETKVIPTWVSVVNLILAVLSMAWSFYDIIASLQEPGSPAFRIIGDILIFVIMIAALEFGFRGFQKGAAKVYKFFTIVYLIFALNAVMYLFALTAASSVSYVSVFTKAITFGCVCILTIALDLGKKKSYILCGVNLLMALVGLIIVICTGITSIMQLGSPISGLAAAFTLCLMVYAKYKDKDARGTV